MKIKFVIEYGDRYGREHARGAVVEFVDAIAVKLIRHGIAVPVVEHVVVAKIQEAPSVPTERAVKPKAHGRKG